MGLRDLWDALVGSATSDTVKARTTWTVGPLGPGMDGSLSDWINRYQGNRTRGWNIPTISEALSVPAFYRSVSLIKNTGASLTPLAYRNGAIVETPQVIARPDPYQSPNDFYRDVYHNGATRGEAVLWIAMAVAVVAAARPRTPQVKGSSKSPA
jgi:hypothetical protein